MSMSQVPSDERNKVSNEINLYIEQQQQNVVDPIEKKII
jgi:hypothetical protein